MRFIVEDNFDRWDKLQDGVYWDGSTLYICSFVTSLGDLGVNPTAIYSFASVPPTCTDNTFTGYGAYLTIPPASYGAYFTAEYWCNFAYMYNDAVETTGITLSNSEAKLTVGESINLTANVSPNNASYQGMQWRSTNKQVATVDYEGHITARAVGECDIIASCVFYQAVCHVKVEDIPNMIVVISDMEIDRMTNLRDKSEAMTMMEQERAKWRNAHLPMPKLIYWNVMARNNIILDDAGDDGVSFVSGCSPVIFKSILTGKMGKDLMYEVLNSKRYEPIHF